MLVKDSLSPIGGGQRYPKNFQSMGIHKKGQQAASESLSDSLGIKLPPKLSIYRNASYAVQGRAKVVNKFITIAQCLFGSAVLLQSAEYLILQRYETMLYIPVMLMVVGLLQVFKVLLRRGRLDFVSDALGVTCMLGAWSTLLLESNVDLSVLNNFFYVFVAMCALPMIIPNLRMGYILACINVVFVLGFIAINHKSIDAMGIEGWDTITDFIFSMLMAGVLIVYAHKNYDGELRMHTAMNIKLRSLNEEVSLRERQHREFIDSFPEVMFGFDIEGRLSYLNGQGYAMFGIDRNTPLSSINVFDLLLEGDRTRLKNSLAKHRAGKLSMGSDYQINVGGRRGFYKFYLSRIIEGGRCVGAEGMAIDISVQKHLETELQHREELVQVMGNETPNIIVMADDRGQILMVSRAFYRAELVREDSIVGRHLSSFAHTAHFASPEFMTQLFANGYTVNTEICVELPNQPTRQYQAVVQPVWSSSPMMFISMTDITEQRAEMERMKVREAELHRVLQSLPNMVMLTDVDDNLVWCNQELENFLDFRLDDIEGKSIYNVVKPLIYREELWRRLGTDGMVRNMVQPFSTQSGKEFEVLLSASLVNQSGRQLLLSSMVDTSAMRRSQANLERILNSIPNMVALLDENINIRWANDAILHFLRLSRDESVNAPLYSLVRKGSVVVTNP